jgi:hypothetical protein
MSFFWAKTPALDALPVQRGHRFWPPKRAVDSTHIARRRGTGCGVVKRANETQQCPRSTAQAQRVHRAL